MPPRYLAEQVRADLRRGTVLLAGPVGVGKTTLARSIQRPGNAFLSWDVPAERESILRRELPEAGPLVFDELPRYPSWLSYLRSLEEDRPGRHRVLATGSARSDRDPSGTEILGGMVRLLRLHPFSAAEVGARSGADLRDLLNLGGFPEPLFGGKEREARLWSLSYRRRLAHDEAVGSEADRAGLERLLERLPGLVGEPLSVNALRADLGAGHKTVSRWLDLLEDLYAIARLAPLCAPGLRAVRKARKHYHYDWTLVEDPRKRFENLTAMHLLKQVHFLRDAQNRDVELRFFRDVDGREVDFVVVEDGRPRILVDARLEDEPLSRGLPYLLRRFPEAHAFQISAAGRWDRRTPEGVRVCPAAAFLRVLV